MKNSLKLIALLVFSICIMVAVAVGARWLIDSYSIVLAGWICQIASDPVRLAKIQPVVFCVLLVVGAKVGSALYLR